MGEGRQVLRRLSAQLTTPPGLPIPTGCRGCCTQLANQAVALVDIKALVEIMCSCGQVRPRLQVLPAWLLIPQSSVLETSGWFYEIDRKEKDIP